ncbi:MAG TPA: PPC domain-containing DNA-binding protein [Candidatus Limnocylindria bacterium]|nr:PPC domain-containing DNA-binding protein [Candidatus Limnocylindria bacterium]
MKVILQDQNQFILRFDKGEEVIAGLSEFMKNQKVGACVFSGLGSCGEVDLGFYNGHVKDFRKKPYFEEMEILTFQGNGGLQAGQPVVHAHGIFGRNDFTTLGAHVFKMTISATCEIALTKLEGSTERKLNADLNLNTLV